MAKRKLKIAFIANDTARRTTFKKRCRGLEKKVKELSTLCGVDVCAMVFSPFTYHPDLYPSPQAVETILARFRSMPIEEQNKKMMSHEDFLRHRIAKATEQLHRLRRENSIKDLTRVMHSGLASPDPFTLLQGLSLESLDGLRRLIDQNIILVSNQMEKIAATEVKIEPQVREEMDLELPWFMEWTENDNVDRRDH